MTAEASGADAVGKSRYTEIDDLGAFLWPPEWSIARMARKAKVNVTSGNKAPSRPVVSDGQQRWVATPRPDLFVIKIGDAHSMPQASPREKAAGVVASVGKVMKKPGADRARVFQSSSGKRVYAYFIEAGDPGKVVREDKSGRRTEGRFINGHFRTLATARRD